MFNLNGEVMNTIQLLSRSEMKEVKGGNIRGGCSTTNCWICDTGNQCKEFDHSLPPEGCTWGICEECCN